MKANRPFKRRRIAPQPDQKPFFSRESTSTDRPFFQTKLTIGQPNDHYEQEADSVADQVVNGQNQQPVVQRQEISSIQRESLATPPEEEEQVQMQTQEEEEPVQMQAEEEEEPIQMQTQEEEEKPLQMKTEEEEEPIQMQAEEEEEPIQMQTQEEEEPIQMQSQEEEEPLQMKTQEEEEPVQMQAEEEEEPIQMQTQEEEEEEPLQMKTEEEEEEKEPIQMKAQAQPQTATSQVSNRIKETSGKGQALSEKTRAEMEQAFGVNFNGVNIHTDSEAVQLSQELGAQAFTHGKDVYFNSGKFSPENSEGKRLLAHELTHVVQQQGGSKTEQTLTHVGSKTNNQNLIAKKTIQLAPDTDQCELDWNSGLYDAQKHKFHGGDRPKGTDKERYDKLCPMYRSHGIPSPLKYIRDNIRQASFFGFTTPAHKNMVGKLANAESILKGMNITTVPLTKVWAFNARTTSEGTWSNHATGKAIDFDSHLNPHLTNKTHRRIIKAMTGTNIEAANPGASTGLDSYDASKQASDDFKGRYSIQGVGERISELQDIKLFYDTNIASLQEGIAELSTTRKDRKENKEKIKEFKALRDDDKKHSADLKISIKALQKELIRMNKLDQKMDQMAGKIQTLNDAIDLLNAQIDGNTNAKEVRKLKASLAKKQKTLKKTIKAYEAADDDTLRQYGNLGFLNLPKEIVEAMQSAGFSWGGDWKVHKDFMHFEID